MIDGAVIGRKIVTVEEDRIFLEVGNEGAGGFKGDDAVGGLRRRKNVIVSRLTVDVRGVFVEDAFRIAVGTVAIEHGVAGELGLDESDFKIGIERQPASIVIAIELSDRSQKFRPRHGFLIDDPIRAEYRRFDRSDCGF